jgi:hypothetical protein
VTTASLASRARGAAASLGRTLLDLDGAALAQDFAEGMMRADARAPTWGSYRPGLGPHTEVQTVALVMAELARTHPVKWLYATKRG